MKKFITLFLVFFALTLSAQSITITGSLYFTGTVIMPQNGTFAGKPNYQGSTIYTFDCDGIYSNVSAVCRWSTGNNSWNIYPSSDLTNPVYRNNSNTATPPGTGWVDLCPGGIPHTITISVTLPIELTAFDIQNTEGGKNYLTWRTASEVNNSHFDIERSSDGTTFHSIGQVKGNNKPSSYEFVDNQSFVLTYYRLRQMDFDGTETLSKIVSVKHKDGIHRVSIYPNPVSNTLTVEQTAGLSRADMEEGDFQIFNLLGQQVLTGKTGQQVDVSALPQGTYVLKVGAEQVKFVKQ